MLTPFQISSLNKIIDNKINGFIAQNISIDNLTNEEIKALRNAGVQVERIQPKDLLVYQSYAFGLISGAVPKSVLNATTYDSFKKYLESGKFIPLNSYEKGVIKSLERQSMSDIRGIGEKYKKTIESATISAERQYYEDTIRRNISEGQAKKDSLRNISNNIAKELDAFGRNFDRIVATVSHQAFDEGRQAFFERNYGENASFYYQVFEGACKICIGNYLTAGLGSEPKIFKIGELPSPQVNYGRKQKDWITTLSPAHPFCRCTSHPVPEGYSWDDKTKSFAPGTERKVPRKSKVKISFGDKEYEV